jgi:DNA-binding transcriptional LysR family regulator
MTLTPEGQRLLAMPNRCSRWPRKPANRCAPIRRGPLRGPWRVPPPPAEATGRYHAAWPDVELDLTTGTTQSLVDAVLDRRLDCAVVAHPGKGAARDLDIEMGAGLEGTFIRTEELVLVLPATHPKVRGPQDVTLRHLAAFARGCTYRRCAEEWLEEGGDEVRRSLSVMEMPSYHAILASVAAGSAVGIVPRALLALHPDHAEFQTVPVRPAHTFLVKRAGFTTSAFEAFQRELRHV